jgi:hypothetical protein
MGDETWSHGQASRVLIGLLLDQRARVIGKARSISLPLGIQSMDRALD